MANYVAIIGNREYDFTVDGDADAVLLATRWLSECARDGEFTHYAPCDLTCDVFEPQQDDDEDCDPRSVCKLTMFLKAQEGVEK